MSAKTITTSVNIASLDSKIIADLCSGIFYIDVTPSVWIGSGASNVSGASVKIVNPYNVTIKNYPTSGYDIYPPMTSDVEVAVPTQASNYQYGTYQITIRLTDADGTDYEVTKSLKICAPDSKNKTRNYGSLSAIMDGDCTTGKVTIIVDTPPNYQGYTTDSQVNDFVLKYPTVSQVAPEEDITLNNFTAQLYEGEYRLEGTICASYTLGDNTYAKVNYRVKRIKPIRCLLDTACIAANLAQLQNQLDSDCSDAEKADTLNTMTRTLFLVTTINALAKDGQDPSDFIDELEKVLGCTCTCNCAEGTPIIPVNTTGDYVVEGCNVSVATAGLTTTYTIENYEYITEITDNGGAIVITTPTLGSCTKTQTITFSIAVVYAQIKAQINNSTEFNYWASVTNNVWDDLDITCLSGTTQLQWDSYTFKQRAQAIIDELCLGGECEATISTNAVSDDADNVVVTWNNVSDVYEVAVYLDGILVGTVLDPTETFTIAGAADGNAHTYILVSKCSNGSTGTVLTGTFTYAGCPLIAVPTLSDYNISDATCPYDLTALVATLPMGITAEWHTLNNTLATSLVADPSQAIGGTYYVFAKNTDGCYSLGVNVILTCSSDTACSAPQNLIAEAITGDFRIRFQSAAYPPPLNSYTVKRRLTADTDIPGNYTTIGTPTWNATVSRWEIIDTTGIDNTLYTYRAFSNCDSSTPYVDYIFANLTCPTLTLTPAQTSMAYSFTGVGGGVDKYEVKIYDATGVTLIHTDTHVPAFPSPITGTFTYLDDNTTYKVRIRIYIGTYYYDCSFVVSTTILTDNYILSASYNYSIDSVTGTGVPSPALPATGSNGTQSGHHTAMSGSYSIVLTGSAVPVTVMAVFVNSLSIASDCIDISAGAGTYNLTFTALETDTVRISIVNGVC